MPVPATAITTLNFFDLSVTKLDKLFQVYLINLERRIGNALDGAVVYVSIGQFYCDIFSDANLRIAETGKF